MSTNPPGNAGRTFSGLLTIVGLLVLLTGMVLAVSGDGDKFWNRQHIELGIRTWACEFDELSQQQQCRSGMTGGKITDKGSSFPLTVSLFGLGLIGAAVVLRLRPAPSYPPITSYAPPSGYPTPTSR